MKISCNQPITPLKEASYWQLSLAFFFLLVAALLYLWGGYQIGFLSINTWGAKLPDTLWTHLTFLGDARVGVVFVLPFAIRYPRLAWALLWIALIGGIFTHTLKPWFDMSRPPAVLDADSFHLLGPALRKGSFPSGHSLTIFAIAGFCLAFFGALKQRVLIILIAAVIASSRAIVGVHWPLDILVGSAGGLISAWIGLYFSGLTPWGWRSLTGQMISIGVLIAVTLSLFGFDGGFEQNQYTGSIIALSVLAFSLRNFWRCQNSDKA